MFNKKLIIGILSVPLGFVMGNPYAVLDYKKFLEDFLYNYMTTPVYAGSNEGSSYLAFLGSSFELFGVPGSLVYLAALGLSLYWLASKKLGSTKGRFVILTYCVFIIYFLKIGGFPRFETRFALPVFPLMLLATGPFWAAIRPKVSAAICVPLIGYGVLCSLYVGIRFCDDPRMQAQAWVRAEVDREASIESSAYVPHWRKLGFENSYRMPFISTRVRLLREVLKQNPWAYEQLSSRETDDISWFSPEELNRRKADYVAVCSLYYERFFSERGQEYYPQVGAFFDGLLQEKYTYRIVFDERSRTYPRWIYPRKIDFLSNRMTILKRGDS